MVADGKSIAFVRLDDARNGTLLVVPALGGPEREVATLGGGFTATDRSPKILGGWTPDGRWVLVGRQTEASKGLILISAETGEKRRLTTVSRGVDLAGSISPNGQTVAFSRTEGSLYGSDAYVSDLFTVALTPDLRPGEIRRLTNDRDAIFDTAWSGDGSEVFFSSRHGGARGLWRVTVSSGAKPRRIPAGDNANTLAYSARANRLVYEQVIGIDTNIWRVDLSGAGTPPSAFIASTREDSSPIYSADGSKIAFRSDRSGSAEVWTCDSDGSNAMQLTNRPSSGSPRWSPDGSQIAFDSQVEGSWQVFTIPARGGQPRQITTTGGTRPSWSGDGKWIYHQKAGKIWKVPAGGGNSIQITQHGNNPIEGYNGTSLYYTTSEGIAKASTDGSGETLVVADKDAYTISRVFAVTREGIYSNSTGHGLRFFGFAGRPSRVILQPGRRTVLGLTVSPDGRWLLYPQVDREPGSDLMLVENFR